MVFCTFTKKLGMGGCICGEGWGHGEGIENNVSKSQQHGSLPCITLDCVFDLRQFIEEEINSSISCVC